MDIKNIIIGLVAVVGLVLGGYSASNLTKPAPEPSVGALAGPDIPSPYLSWGGVRTYGGRMEPAAATTTICAIQSPVSTSTLVFGSAQLSVSSTSASRIWLAKASTPWATTTSLGVGSLAANNKGTVVASTTVTGAPVDGTLTFAPSTYFVVGMSGGDGGASLNVPQGTCQAQWIEN